jgi:23S rRNA pseudouridine955/2504/2580 synthase
MSSEAADPFADAPLGPGVSLLARHPVGLVALNKPEGILSHPNGPTDEPRSLLTCRYDAQRECFCWTREEPGRRRPVTVRLFLLHRLDSATSGVLLLANSPELAATAKQAFADRAVEKRYEALVFGLPKRETDTWRDALETSRGAEGLRTRPGAGAPAVTDMHLISKRDSEFGWISRLELRPKTGRTHQLRVQCQRRKLPIIGDQTYGDFSLNRAYARQTGAKRLHLHACSITLTLPSVSFCVTSPAPWHIERP